MKKIAGIYRITNKSSGKVYIGQSIDIGRRLYQHINYLERNNHDNEILQRAWNKYGRDDFEFSIIKICNPSYEELNKWEKYFMEKYDSLSRNKGFNIAMGGDNSGNTIAGFTEEQYKAFCKKLSENQKKWLETHEHPNKGKPMSEAQKKKLSEGRKGEKSWMYGKKRPEHSALMTGAGNSRAIRIRCVETNEEFGCIKDAAVKYGTSIPNILHVLNKEQQTAKKMHWEYV